MNEKKDILEALDRANYEKVFVLIDEYLIADTLYIEDATTFNQLKTEFIAGKYGADYAQRLKLFIISKIDKKMKNRSRKGVSIFIVLPISGIFLLCVLLYKYRCELGYCPINTWELIGTIKVNGKLLKNGKIFIKETGVSKKFEHEDGKITIKVTAPPETYTTPIWTFEVRDTNEVILGTFERAVNVIKNEIAMQKHFYWGEEILYHRSHVGNIRTDSPKPVSSQKMPTSPPPRLHVWKGYVGDSVRVCVDSDICQNADEKGTVQLSIENPDYKKNYKIIYYKGNKYCTMELSLGSSLPKPREENWLVKNE